MLYFCFVTWAYQQHIIINSNCYLMSNKNNNVIITSPFFIYNLYGSDVQANYNRLNNCFLPKFPLISFFTHRKSHRRQYSGSSFMETQQTGRKTSHSSRLPTLPTIRTLLPLLSQIMETLDAHLLFFIVVNQKTGSSVYSSIK